MCWAIVFLIKVANLVPGRKKNPSRKQSVKQPNVKSKVAIKLQLLCCNKIHFASREKKFPMYTQYILPEGGIFSWCLTQPLLHHTIGICQKGSKWFCKMNKMYGFSLKSHQKLNIEFNKLHRTQSKSVLEYLWRIFYSGFVRDYVKYILSGIELFLLVDVYKIWEIISTNFCGNVFSINNVGYFHCLMRDLLFSGKKHGSFCINPRIFATRVYQ